MRMTNFNDLATSAPETVLAHMGQGTRIADRGYGTSRPIEETITLE